MRVNASLAVTMLLVAVAGCLRAGPPKTPNQRAVEEAARREERRDEASRTPPSAPGTLPAREPIPALAR